MDPQPEETECPNCKRDIPKVNYLVHTMHCARNICVCPTCKEPVPNSDMQDHYNRIHKLNPCKKCGEQVCGSDLEDHIRDSCAHTVRACRFCELELPRSELPNHENYCGTRTEQCPECREYVMIKYRQLHVDSNHGFIKLDDEIDYTPRPKATNGLTSASSSKQTNIQPNSNRIQNKLEPMLNAASNSTERPNSPNTSLQNSVEMPSSSGHAIGLNGLLESDRPKKNNAMVKRTNDRPQVNTAVVATSKINSSSLSRGAIKKRPAPKPPSPNPIRDLALYSALSRHQREEKARTEQNQCNLANEYPGLSLGLPPVLTPAEKVEKLRKMDALHNREETPEDYKNRLQGRCWFNPDETTSGNMLGAGTSKNSTKVLRLGTAANNEGTARNGLRSGKACESADLRNLQPMTQAQFLNRYQELQLSDSSPRRPPDRFSEIKSSLRELRRGLNDATAPYNTAGQGSNRCEGNCAANCAGATCRGRPPAPPPPRPPASPPPLDAEGEGDEGESESEVEVRLPCEFCNALLPADDLVQHQTGCRPDLTQLKPNRSPSPACRSSSPLYRPSSRPSSRSPTWYSPPSPSYRPSSPVYRPSSPVYRPSSPVYRSTQADPYTDPVIPCEFCTESLPVYLITEHQERCRQDNTAQLLYPD